MITNLTVNDLIAFESEVADLFNAAKIRAPIHLYSGCEVDMINVFQGIREKDWVFCSWRSHYQCLLKGVPRQQLLDKIVAGHSMTLCFPEHRIASSAILGGILPIALGVAMAIAHTGWEDREHVYCWMGDMTSESGIAHECIKYAKRHWLPITWIVEDNNQSTCTPTRAVWSMDELIYESREMQRRDEVFYYRYNLTYPHSGAGKRVQF